MFCAGVGVFSVFEYTDVPVLVSGGRVLQFVLGEKQLLTQEGVLSDTLKQRYQHDFGVNPEHTFWHFPIESQQCYTHTNYQQPAHLPMAPLGTGYVLTTHHPCPTSAAHRSTCEGAPQSFSVPSFLRYASQLLSSAKHVRHMRVYMNGAVLAELDKSSDVSLDRQLTPAGNKEGAIQRLFVE